MKLPPMFVTTVWGCRNATSCGTVVAGVAVATGSASRASRAAACAMVDVVAALHEVAAVPDAMGPRQAATRTNIGRSTLFRTAQTPCFIEFSGRQFQTDMARAGYL